MMRRLSSHHYSALALLSISTLLLELSLTRVLSVMLWCYFGSLVISTALLGFGTAGTLLVLWEGLRDSISFMPTIWWAPRLGAARSPWQYLPLEERAPSYWQQ